MYQEFYTGNPSPDGKEQWKNLPIRRDYDSPQGYIPSPDLKNAVNVALTLGRPLLLTGEPGTGKSSLAKSIAYELGCKHTGLKVEVKSTTTAKDLFYTFDHVGWFNARPDREGTSASPENFLTLTGLGKAIVYASAEDYSRLLEEGANAPTEQSRSVVLLDEIDKAPRDVPNDILNEIDQLYFRIPELGNLRVTAEAKYRPIVIITSNSEKALPDAFLRRCIFFHIDFPDKKTLAKIIASRFGEEIDHDARDSIDKNFGKKLTEKSQLLNDSIDLLTHMRDDKYRLPKKPGASELIEFIEMLRRTGLKATDPLRGKDEQIKACFSSLLKSPVPQATRDQLITGWQGTGR